MIPVERLLYKIDLKLDKLASNSHQGIPLEDKILVLNEAQKRLIKEKVNLNNLYRLGFDAFKSRYEDLQNLVVQYEQVVPTKTNERFTSYSFPIDTLNEQYYLPVDIIVIGSKGRCKDRTISTDGLTKHGDLTTLMENEAYTPSFLYQKTLAVMSGNEVIVYSNDPKGDFDINKVLFSYMRYPNKIDYEGYVNFDNEPSVTQDCELPDYLEDELLSLAVMELGFDTGNQFAAQAEQIKKKGSE